MRKRRVYLVLLILAVAGLVGLIVAGAFRSREPEYKGRKLTEWLEIDYVDSRNVARDQVDEAFAHFGTSIVPCLISWIGYEPSPWKTKFLDVAGAICHRLHSPPPSDFKDHRGDLAVAGFRKLGPAARGACSELGRLMNDPNRDRSASRATDALVFVGKESLPTLLATLTNSPHADAALYACKAIGELGTNALPALPTLLQCLASSSETELRRSSSLAIAKLGTNAFAAFPLFVECLTNKDEELACFAASGAAEVAPDDPAVLPALVAALGDSRRGVRECAAEALGSLGAKARGALPALRNALADPDTGVQVAVGTAIGDVERAMARESEAAK